jgi:ElaB/YqjD/DUF883 family membrane-anchored ribosome-binding protein
MTIASESEVQALRADMEQLRADFAKVCDTLKEIARHRKADAVEQVDKTIDLALQGLKAGGKEVTETLQERPLASALTAFGVGMALGLVLNRRPRQ